MNDERLHRIELPTSFRIHTMNAVLTRLQFFPKEKPSSFDLCFNPDHDFLDPTAMSMLAAWGDHWISMGIPVTCSNFQARAVRYAHRMGLFNIIPAAGLPTIDTHEEAGRFLVLRKISDQTSVEFHDATRQP